MNFWMELQFKNQILIWDFYKKNFIKKYCFSVFYLRLKNVIIFYLKLFIKRCVNRTKSRFKVLYLSENKNSLTNEAIF